MEYIIHETYKSDECSASYLTQWRLLRWLQFVHSSYHLQLIYRFSLDDDHGSCWNPLEFRNKKKDDCSMVIMHGVCNRLNESAYFGFKLTGQLFSVVVGLRGLIHMNLLFDSTTSIQARLI